MQKTGVGEVAPEPFHEEYIRGFFSENVKPVEEVIGKKIMEWTITHCHKQTELIQEF